MMKSKEFLAMTPDHQFDLLEKARLLELEFELSIETESGRVIKPYGHLPGYVAITNPRNYLQGEFNSVVSMGEFIKMLKEGGTGMTIEAEIRKRLEAMGLCFDRLDACMDYIKSNPALVGWVWQANVSAYGEVGLLVLWSSVQGVAIEWLVQQVGQPTKGE